MSAQPDLFTPPSDEDAAKEQVRRIKATRVAEARERAALRQELQRACRRRKPPCESKVKRAVRKRDGYRCRDCGIIWSEQSPWPNCRRKEEPRNLSVHRVDAGSVYEVDRCVTLCEDCHAKKKNKEHEDLFALRWNLYSPDDVRVLKTLLAEAKKAKVPFPVFIDQVLMRFARSVDGAPSVHADGRP